MSEPIRRSTASARTRALPFLVLAVVVAGTYSNTLWNGFHLDDFYRIRDNPEIRRVTPVLRHFADPGTISGSRGFSESALTQIGQYRPLLPLSLSINYALGELSLPGYHVGNIGLHLAGTILVYLLVALLLARAAPGAFSRVAGARWAALAVAAVYAVHPLSGYPVNYILARDLLLMQVFLLASLLVYGSAPRRPSVWRWIAALVLLELALLSKVTAAVAPLLVLAWEWTIAGKDLRTSAAWKRVAPFAAVVVGHLGFVALLLDFGDLSRVQAGAPWSWTYALTQADVHVAEYIRNFVWPEAIRMAPYVVPRTSLWEPRVLIGIAAIAATLALAVPLRRGAPVAAFAILGYWILMVPESSVLPISHLAVHYRAFPSSWLLYLGVALALVRWTRPRFAAAVGSTAVAAFALASFSMNRTYRSEESLWAHSVEHGGEALAHMNYAMSLPERDDPRVREHLERAVAMSPNYVLAHVNLGLLDLDTGKRDAGLERLRQVARMAPDWPEAHYWLSVGLDREGEVDPALDAAEAASALDPGNVEYASRLALASSRAGRFEAALDAARRVLSVDPAHAGARFVEAHALLMSGKARESTRSYASYLTMRPDDLEARLGLAYAWISLGRCGDAVPHLKALLEKHADHAAAEQYMGMCEEEAAGGSRAADRALERHYQAAFAAYRAGDYRRSLEFVRLVEALRPDYAETRFLEAFDLQMLDRLEESVAAYEAYLSSHPGEAQVHFNAGHALARLGRCPEAVEHLERTLELRPEYAEARDLLSSCAARRSAREAPSTPIEETTT